jgi:tetratricopeptide (TPR) repeat protein
MNREKRPPPQPAWALVPLLLALLLGITHRPAGLDAHFSGARQALGSGDPAGAGSHLAGIAAQLPWRDTLWEMAGRAALAGGDIETAVFHLENAAQGGHITPAGWLALGDAYRAQTDWDAALQNWRRALDAGADPIEVHARFLQAHRTLGDYPAAIGDLQTLAALDPSNAAVRYQLGLFLATREPHAALDHLLQAAALDAALRAAVEALTASLQPAAETDDPAFTLLSAGRTLASLGEWELAAEAFRQAALANPGYAEAWAFLGEAQQQLGRDGGSALETALSLDPESLTANLLTGLYFMRQGQPGSALVYFTAAARRDPENPAIQTEIAGAHAALGDINAALEHFQHAIALAPGDPAYLHLLAAYSIYNDIQVEEAGLPAARAAVILNPEDPVALDLIGYSLHLRGDALSALRFLSRALNADPNYAPARLHLGLVYLAQDKVEQAAAQFHLVIRLAPETPWAADAARLLQQYTP